MSFVWSSITSFEPMQRLTNITQALQARGEGVMQVHRCAIEAVPNFLQPWLGVDQAYVRTTSLCAQHKPVTYSQVLIDIPTYQEHKAVIDGLGDRPIGSTLLYAQHFVRSAFEFSCAPWGAAQQMLQTSQKIPIRRSIFTGPFTVFLVEGFSPEYVW